MNKADTIEGNALNHTTDDLIKWLITCSEFFFTQNNLNQHKFIELVQTSCLPGTIIHLFIFIKNIYYRK